MALITNSASHNLAALMHRLTLGTSRQLDHTVLCSTLLPDKPQTMAPA